MSITTYLFVTHQLNAIDPYTTALLTDAHALGFTHLAQIAYSDLYFIQGQLSAMEKTLLSTRLFCDPVTQTGYWQTGEVSAATGQLIETALRPGVTDPVAEQILQGARSLGIQGIQQVTTGRRFVLHSLQPFGTSELNALAQRLLINPVIQYYAIGSLEAAFAEAGHSSAQVETIALNHLATAELLQLSTERRSALDTAEMLAIQAYFQTAQREPTDVEFETIAQTWSEHCSHKTFRAQINTGTTTIDGLLKTYIRAATETIAAPWVWSAFVDNAGIIDFDDAHQISFKVETHNHPSAIEPFGGANTGLGGVIRDVLGVSAKPIAATDILCFGPQDLAASEVPPGTLHPQRIYAGVIAGVQDYGNKTGIPTVNGTLWYDAGYIANPLVYCGCVGLAPARSHPRNPRPGDRVIVLGGRTGRDGLRGATFSSMTMDAQTGSVAGASVQIGDPIIAKGLIEVVTRARDAQLYTAITDCGAGGLSSAVGEMASEIGADVELMQLPLKYSGLAPWEIWLSEAQERMVLAVPASHVVALQAICSTFDIELTDIGAFTDTGQLIVRYQQTIVLQLTNDFLHHGMPRKTLRAELPAPVTHFASQAQAETDLAKLVLRLLGHPNIASKESVIRLYDHEVQSGTVVKPLTGILNDGPSDACVIKPITTAGMRGIVLANGLNPEIGKYDAYRMAVSVIDEAIRNAVAVGADPDRIAILDNFCWGDPNRPTTLGALVQACQGCHDAALHYGTPFISGKDSLNNEYYSKAGQRHAIPSTLLISALGIIEDVQCAVTMDFKRAGNIIYLLGTTQTEFAGSHFVLCGGQPPTDTAIAPALPDYAPALYRALHRAMQQKLVRACHDLSEGGLAVALAEMCIGGRVGCEVKLATADTIITLFSESNGRLLVEIEPEQCAAFEAALTTMPLQRLGKVTAAPRYVIQAAAEQTIIALDVATLTAAWQRS